MEPVSAEDEGLIPGREQFRRCGVWRQGTRMEDSKGIVDPSTPKECETIGGIGAIVVSSETLRAADSRKFHPRGFPGTRIVVVPQRIVSRSLSSLEGQGRCVRPKGGFGGFEESGTPTGIRGSPAVQPATTGHETKHNTTCIESCRYVEGVNVHLYTRTFSCTIDTNREKRRSSIIRPTCDHHPTHVKARATVHVREKIHVVSLQPLVNVWRRAFPSMGCSRPFRENGRESDRWEDRRRSWWKKGKP